MSAVRTAKIQHRDIVVFVEGGKECMGEWIGVSSDHAHHAFINPLDDNYPFNRRAIPLSMIVSVLDTEASDAFRVFTNGGNTDE